MSKTYAMHIGACISGEKTRETARQKMIEGRPLERGEGRATTRACSKWTYESMKIYEYRPPINRYSKAIIYWLYTHISALCTSPILFVGT